MYHWALIIRGKMEMFGLGWPELILICIILLMMLVAFSTFYVILKHAIKREIEKGAKKT
jgi:hypothetical protein